MIFESLDMTTISPSLRKRLEVIYQNRSRNSKEFFRQNIDQFAKQQDLIASYVDYGEAIADFIKTLSLNKGTCIEIGVGEGDFLINLCKLFRKVLALDNNTDMLAKARNLPSKTN